MRISMMLVFILFIPAFLSAATLNVPGQYATIQGAIDASVNGDTVLVDPGIYKENIDFLGKAILVTSSGGAATTTIQGITQYPQYFYSVVSFRNGEGNGSILNGFTLTNGQGTVVDPWGTVGGGILCRGASPTIMNNIISNNTAGYGGGIECMDSASPVISGNVFHDNHAFNQSGGGIDCFTKASPLIENNVLYANITSQHGGGIMVWDSCKPLIVNNTIYGNSASTGAGIYILGQPVIKNNIVRENTTNQISGLASDVTYCNVQGGYAGTGNIDEDPLFADPVNNDVHLTSLSPCINRGTNSGAPSNDLDGDARPCMGTVDMGADEFTGTHLLEADTFALSEASGGTVNFAINAGAANGNRAYVILGSITGTAPGTPLPGGEATLPLNWDLFTNVVIDFINSAMFSGFMGTLSPGGSAAPVFNTLGPIPGIQDITLSFACGLNGPWDFASNPISVEITP